MIKNQISEQNSSKPSRSIAEKFSLSISIFILVLLLGLVVYSWRIQKHKPPVLTLTQPEAIRQEQEQFYVTFTVINEGGETAQSVQVIGEFYSKGEVIEQGEQQIDYLSGGESASGAFIFSGNPQDGEVKIRVGSYKLP
ncbi:conserved hypothetical protein [Planktothrix serta PCC 8927]|uniref:CARDB domain-containing protein n=1 Tax=Planktothrix serta PCC 8927 TaxID=671068 RepID=A0A7Z9E050_9CYAN|nr:TIGR02588 family protein [Planktothrix serta]VXD15781.1 conserved hypothetical protein [Planktothrix serta PCC 8927]